MHIHGCVDSAVAAAAAAPCCYTAVAAAAAAVRHGVPDGIFLLWFIDSDSRVFFLFIQTRVIFNAPLGSTVAFCGLDFPIIHPRQLRARTAPRRASARRGEAPLVCIYGIVQGSTKKRKWSHTPRKARKNEQIGALGFLYESRKCFFSNFSTWF